MDTGKFAESIFSLDTWSERHCEALWAYQRTHNPIIQRYCEGMGTDALQFMPIAFFKALEMKTASGWEPQAVFESSGTTGQVPSRHFVRNLKVYERAALRGFFHFFEEKPYRILALLPSYLERKNASLVQMVRMWIDTFGVPGSGFYLNNLSALEQAIHEAAGAGEPILLIGVAFALLDFAEGIGPALPPDTIVMETGGMKGRRKEIIRAELHERLKAGFNLDRIHSEYGMTELLSQMYALGDGRFRTPPWVKVVISDLHLSDLTVRNGVAGRINLIDMANIHSCAFIATDDIGRMHPDGSFEVLGRIDGAELRGCSLMVG